MLRSVERASLSAFLMASSEETGEEPTSSMILMTLMPSDAISATAEDPAAPRGVPAHDVGPLRVDDVADPRGLQELPELVRAALELEVHLRGVQRDDREE